MSEKVNILFSSFPDFSGNPKALYEYILNTYPDKFNLYWVIYHEESTDILKKLNINFVLYKSEEFYELNNKINIIFDTNGELYPSKSKEQIYVNMWHGSSPKKKGYLLPPQNFAQQDTEYYKMARRKTDFLLVPSEFSKLIFSSVFNINSQRVIPLGYPRDEYLLKSDGLSNLHQFTKLDLKKFNKIIFYLPTFRNGCNRRDGKNIFENNILNIKSYNEEELLEFLEKNNFLLVVKKHPSETNNFNSINSSNILMLSEDEMKKKNITIYEILNSADLLIADYSSVYVEFLLLERPVLFLHKDIDTYTKNRGLILQDTNIWFPGPKVLDISELVYNIEKLLTDETFYQKERKDFRNLMFNKDVFHISKDIFEYFFELNTFSLKHKHIPTLEEELEHRVNELNEKIEQNQQKIELLTKEKKSILDQKNKLQKEISNIYNSRSWKVLRIFQRKKKGEKIENNFNLWNI